VAGGVGAAGITAAVLVGAIPPVGLALAIMALGAGAMVSVSAFRRRALASRPVRPAAPTSADLVAQVEGIEADIAGKVPPAVASRVRRICTTVRNTIPRLDQLGAGSAQAHSVVATATSYLPEAVGGYLRLPREWADTRPVANGKTSLMVLCDQLDLLGYKMDEVYDAVCKADADALIVHGEFLKAKFTSSTLSVAPDLGRGT
jgi:hypothetical protein